MDYSGIDELKELINSEKNRLGGNHDDGSLFFFDTLLKLCNRQNDFFEHIEQQVKNTYKPSVCFDIYNALLPKNKIEELAHIFSPIHYIQELTMPKKAKLFKKKQLFSLDTVYIDLSYPELQRLIERNLTFDGYIIDTNDNKYRFTFKIHKNNTFDEIEKELYQVFCKNNVVWRTLNVPYARKMFDVKLFEYFDPIENLEDIKDIHLDYGYYEPYIKPNLLPSWNIDITKKLMRFNKTITCPIDEITYYKYIIEDELPQNKNFLITSSTINIESVVQKNECIEILSKQECKQVEFSFYTFNNITGTPKQESFPIFSNKQSQCPFIDVNTSIRPKTKGGIVAVINSFNDLKNNICVKNASVHEYGNDSNVNIADAETYNNFVPKFLSSYTKRKSLLIEIEIINKNTYTEDLISFIKSQLQMVFDEFVIKVVII